MDIGSGPGLDHGRAFLLDAEQETVHPISRRACAAIPCKPVTVQARAPRGRQSLADKKEADAVLDGDAAAELGGEVPQGDAGAGQVQEGLEDAPVG